MRQRQNYFVFNKPADYRRGWGDNIRCLGSAIRAEDPGRPGVLWSRLLDSREKETVWHRMTMDCGSLGEASVRFAFYCAEGRTLPFRGKNWDLEELLRSPGLTDQDRREAFAPFLKRTALSPGDILLHDLTGRYLWFRAELLPQGGQSPEVGNLTIRFPKETWLRYLPEVYQAEAAGRSLRSKTSRAAGTEMHTAAAWGARALLASPGTEFCSWSTYGTPRRRQQLSSAIST